MLNRRDFIVQLAGTATATAVASGQGWAQAPAVRSSRMVVYASEGKAISSFSLDTGRALLQKIATVEAAETVQFAALHPGRKTLYAALSNGGPGGRAGDTHYLSAYFVDRDNGAIHPYGPALALPDRPIHVAVDPAGSHVLVVFNKPAALRVYRLGANGMLQQQVEQAVAPAVGIFPHQVVCSPTGDRVYVCGRGNDAAPGKAADVGSLTTLRFQGGQLSADERMTFGDGIGPRELALHPRKPWVFVSLERGNKLAVYPLGDTGIRPVPLFVAETLREPGKLVPRQRAGAVHIHPNGKTVYIANRSDRTAKRAGDGRDILIGGENNIAVFAIDQDTGEPRLLQHIDAGGVEPRSFVISPDGRLLVAGNQSATYVEQGGGVALLPANLALFRIGADGTLAFAGSRAADSGEELIWTGIADLA